MMVWWTTGSGYVELDIAPEDAEAVAQSGDNLQEVKALMKKPYIKEQLRDLDRKGLKDTLREYGAWDDRELMDHRRNLRRILWIACWDIVEEEG